MRNAEAEEAFPKEGRLLFCTLMFNFSKGLKYKKNLRLHCHTEVVASAFPQDVGHLAEDPFGLGGKPSFSNTLNKFSLYEGIVPGRMVTSEKNY